MALLSGGHILLEGVPGLAKTLLIQTLSDCIDSKFVRLQFTPDLLPADITGTKIYEHDSASFNTIKGPIFSNFILADEINRAPSESTIRAVGGHARKPSKHSRRNAPIKKTVFCNGNSKSS